MIAATRCSCVSGWAGPDLDVDAAQQLVVLLVHRAVDRPAGNRTAGAGRSPSGTVSNRSDMRPPKAWSSMRYLASSGTRGEASVASSFGSRSKHVTDEGIQFLHDLLGQAGLGGRAEQRPWRTRRQHAAGRCRRP